MEAFGKVKKTFIVPIIFLACCFGGHAERYMLPEPSKDVQRFGEIAVLYYRPIVQHWNRLTPHERVFAYYLYRACLPGIMITADQMHRFAPVMDDFFVRLLARTDDIRHLDMQGDKEQFISDVTTYALYIWTNYGPYFLREKENNKRTPERIGLQALTKEHTDAVLAALGDQVLLDQFAKFRDFMFDASLEPTLTVPGSIEKSAVNFYAPDFTEADYHTIDPELQSAINAYFSVVIENGKRVPRAIKYRVGGKYSDEFKVAIHWLKKAQVHARQYPQHFDEHIANSLGLLCDYLETGDEELFKQHSIEWLKTKSKLDYVFGFIESYDDPKSYRGSFEAEVTVKSVDMRELSRLLPSLEKRLPFPDIYQRENLNDTTSMPNASVNAKIFGSGHSGPLSITRAYCLPNYEEIRSKIGSKQVIYTAERKLGELINPDLNRKLFNRAQMAEFLKEHDPDSCLWSDMFDVQVILHETLGHGSGRFHTHVFQEGDPLTINGKTYAIGDEIQVTSANVQQFLEGYDHTIEEMRAEVIALLVSIDSYDELAQAGVIKDWPQKFDKKRMQEILILEMARMALGRLQTQPDGATEISGDHARANTTITNYLVDHGALEFTEETIDVDGKEHLVVDLRVIDLNKAHAVITELAQHVQEIKSTANRKKAKALIETYGKPIRYPKYLQAIKRNHKAVVGDLKVSALITPHFEPVVDVSGQTITDVKASWPKGIVEQLTYLRSIALSTELHIERSAPIMHE